MNRPQRHPLLAALFALALLAGGVGAVQAQQADPAPPASSACPMMGEAGTMDMEGMNMEGMDMQAMVDNCPMMQSDGESGGMMGMMSKMKDCPMMAEMMKDCPMRQGMMDGPVEPDSTMQGRMHRGTNGPSTPAQTERTTRS
jgi:predicted metal-binding membrane protein